VHFPAVAALNELAGSSGRQFRPDLVRVFLEMAENKNLPALVHEGEDNAGACLLQNSNAPGHLLPPAPCMHAFKKAEIDGALSDSNQYLVAGDYQKAIDTFSAAHATYPEDKPLLRSYQKAVER